MKQPRSLAASVTAAFLLGSQARALVRPLQQHQQRADIATAGVLHRLAAVLGDFGSHLLNLEQNMPPSVRDALAAAR